MTTWAYNNSRNTTSYTYNSRNSLTVQGNNATFQDANNIVFMDGNNMIFSAEQDIWTYNSRN